ncbi:MAG: DNA repair protein RadA [Candidatus Omnitrophota bacterium]
MAKSKTIYVCQQCGAQNPRWVGKCLNCGSWNSYVEESLSPEREELRPGIVFDEKPVLLRDVSPGERSRISVGIKEFDRVLGGGLVPGSVTLIGGDPGIGKSTVTLQAIAHLSKRKLKVLYVSGEESSQQTKLRADRLNVAYEPELVFIINQVDILAVQDHIQKMRPDVVVIDSIQVTYHPEITSSAGSVSQVRECAALLTHLAKRLGIAMFIIGHVTKEGAIAGPRVLEHIVDTVLYFEGERYTTYRIIRGIKNRYGPTNEIGVFEMAASGLTEVENPSKLFLSERPEGASGSVVVPIMEGTRPFLVEVQGLVSRSAFGVVRQKAHGFDPNRLALLTAVLEKRLDLNLSDKDVFLNIVGGVKAVDPAIDLAVVVAVASALLDKVVPFDMVFLGEVGLSSEVRSVSQIGVRLREAEKLGFKRCVVPANNVQKRTDIPAGIEVIAVNNVREALDII